MQKFSTVIILLFIFFTFTSCSKDVTPQVPKDETSTTEEAKETDTPEISEVNSKDETIIKDTTSSTETPISNEDTTLSLTPDTTSSEPITEYYYSFGFVNEIDLSSNPTLIIDEAEFYMYDEALQEAIKDDHAFLKKYGTYALMDPYYIRNNYNTITNYPISENCVYYVCMHVADYMISKEVPDYELSGDLFEVSLEDFVESIEYYRNLNARLITWFDVENGEVVKLHQQFTP